MREAEWDWLRSFMGSDSMAAFHRFRATRSTFCSAVDLLVKWTRVGRPRVVISEAFLARLSTRFMPAVPPWPGCQDYGFLTDFSLLFCLTHFTFVNFSYPYDTNLFSYLPFILS